MAVTEAGTVQFCGLENPLGSWQPQPSLFV